MGIRFVCWSEGVGWGLNVLLVVRVVFSWLWSDIFSFIYFFGNIGVVDSGVGSVEAFRRRRLRAAFFFSTVLV